METRYCDSSVLRLYHSLLETELKAILDVSAQQAQLGLSWADLRKYILKDLQELGRRLDLQGKVDRWEFTGV